MSSIFYVFVVHLCIFFGEMSTQTLPHFFFNLLVYQFVGL